MQVFRWLLIPLLTSASALHKTSHDVDTKNKQQRLFKEIYNCSHLAETNVPVAHVGTANSLAAEKLAHSVRVTYESRAVHGQDVFLWRCLFLLNSRLVPNSKPVRESFHGTVNSTNCSLFISVTKANIAYLPVMFVHLVKLSELVVNTTLDTST